jgi:TonB family protein
VLETSSKNLNLAMVGLNPADRALAPPPASPADFSAGRHLRQHGASAQPNTGVLSVPGLFVGKSHENSRPELIAEAFDPPTSKASIRAAINSVHMGSALSSGDNPMPSSAGAVHVTNAPEPRLEGRDVFMMAIQMPNLTSYSGSWLMWYADRTQKQAGLAPVAPPVPHRKVDPKYIASAVAERVEGQVRLACVITKQGTVGGVELLRGIDGRLNQSAEEALAKWEFYPATRNGQPVDVDVVVEIPFRLEPLAPKP